MRTGMANVVVHIDENLDQDQIHTMERDLSFEDGVYSACVHERTPHLMVVDYDPEQVTSGQLLRGIEQHQVHAELIGF